MIIGLTGGIASGKSTVTAYLRSKNIKIVDADKVSRQVVEPGSKGLKKIEGSFGKDILEDGHLNRKKLRELIFSDDEKRILLNRILHPIIHEEIERQLQSFSDEKILIFDAPLLLENNLKGMVDEVWVVSTSLDHQVERVMERDHISREEALKIIDKQMPLSDKIKNADLVLDNNGSVEYLYGQVDHALSKYL